MARTHADELVAAVLHAMHGFLKPVGFSKSGSTFRRETDQALQFVNLQRSTSSTKDQAIVTVNIGFELKGLLKWYRKPRKVSGVWDCNWNARISRYLPNNAGDKWWTIDDMSSAESASREILMTLPVMIDHLSEISTEEGASAAMKNGLLNRGNRELREYLERDPKEEYWPEWDRPITDY